MESCMAATIKSTLKKKKKMLMKRRGKSPYLYYFRYLNHHRLYLKTFHSIKTVSGSSIDLPSSPFFPFFPPPQCFPPTALHYRSGKKTCLFTHSVSYYTSVSFPLSSPFFFYFVCLGSFCSFPSPWLLHPTVNW